MGIISALFGSDKTDFKSLVDQGARIVDVRSPQEFASGHVEGSINIPLDAINAKVASLQKDGKPVITCCRSGTRSAMAAGILRNAGVTVYNGGAWENLRRKIQ
ncbi:Thiosulfate sulfurtransferase GlpE [Dyadobacter sp. CECT 9275]|uniref:Thiosulfate sulfurtransferase GlpE n=1 Tax=Dyadobacter helix TaxID=2822344 RepID=A0A916JE10_9BACT|nr:rhodanese-like domain-containing protein [Dyadobacter sp. CECT 9275]CAG5006118.1 Thiosulfate sulfurtransferase GlpE [Dyadobacter sp. CECT 9275]